MRRSPWLVHASVIGSYILLSLLLTAPLALHFATHVPGDGIDDPALTWNLWWVWDALVHGQNPFQCDIIFHPVGINLAFYTLTVLNGALSGPLQLVLGLVPASNLILLSSYVIGGYGAFLLALRLLQDGPRSGRVPAAWFCGLVYAFAAPKLFYAALGQFNVASSQWVPFAVLCFLEATRGRKTMGAMAGLFLGLQAWAETTYASFLVVLIVLVMGARAVESARAHQPWRVYAGRTVVPAVLAGVIGLVIIAPILAAMIPDMLAEGDFTVVGGGFADVFSADLAGLLVPTMLHPVLGRAVAEWSGVLHYDKGQHLFFGLTVWALALVALWRSRPRPVFWAVSTVVFLALSLGPVMQVNGHSLPLPMPFEIVQELPLFKANRYPSRYGVMMGLSLAVLSAAGLRALMSGPGRRWLTIAAAVLFLCENLSVPLPLSDMTIPSLYGILEHDPKGRAVLELPLAWRNGFRVTGTQDVEIMFSQYYQTAHGKPLLGGNTSRNPEFKFQYFAEMPVLESIIALETGRGLTAVDEERDRAVAPGVLAFLGVSHIVTHSPPVDDALLQYVEEVLPTRLVAEEGGMRIYVVESAPVTGPLDLAESLAEGWGRREAPAPAVRSRARLLVPGSGGGRLELELRGFASGEQVLAEVSGRRIGACALTPEWSTCTVELPLGAGMTQDVVLVSRDVHDPDDLPADRAIGTTGVQAPLDVYARSAGEEFGDLGRIYLSGTDVSPNARGYNLVAVDADSGAVVSARAFDTHADGGASAMLTQYLASLPDGTIVAGAVADEASLNLTEEAATALQSLGLQADLRGCFRCGHGFVGVVGADPGSAVEEWGALGVSEALVGRGLTEPAAYYELASVTLVR